MEATAYLTLAPSLPRFSGGMPLNLHCRGTMMQEASAILSYFLEATDVPIRNQNAGVDDTLA